MKGHKAFWCSILLVLGIVLINIPGAFAKEPVGEELRIGVLAPMSGSVAAFGLVMKYCAMVGTEAINKEGGLLVGGVRHPIKLFIEDDKNDVKVARAGAEKLVHSDKVKYILGPCTSPPTAAAQVVTEPAKVIQVSFTFQRSLVTPEHPYIILGLMTPFQTAPVLYKHLMETYKAKTISYVVKNYSGALVPKPWCIEAAKSLGLKVLSDTQTYEPETADFFPIMGSIIKDKPDIIDLVAPGAGDAAQATKAARQLGYTGVICQHTPGDLNVFKDIAGKYSEGMICIGGATMPGIRTKQMDDFIEAYKKVAGEWNEEAASKLYALEMVCETIKTAGPAAIKDTDAFRAAMPKVAYKNPYVKGNPIMKYIGKSYSGQVNQLGIPIVFVQVKEGKFEVIKVVQLQE